MEKYKHNPFTRVIVSKDPSWYYKPGHKIIKWLGIIARAAKRVLAYLLLILLGLWAITGISSVVSFVIEPVRRQLRRSKGHIADEKHWIEYRAYKSTRTVEEVKELIKNTAVNAKTSQAHRELLKDNFIYPLGDNNHLHLKKIDDYELYDISKMHTEKREIEGEEVNVIVVTFWEKKFTWQASNKKKKVIADYTARQLDILRTKIYSHVVSVYPKCGANLNSDIGEFSWDDKGKEWINLLAFRISEIISLKSIKFVTINDKPGWKPMTKEDIDATIKQIEYEEIMN